MVGGIRLETVGILKIGVGRMRWAGYFWQARRGLESNFHKRACLASDYSPKESQIWVNVCFAWRTFLSPRLSNSACWEAKQYITILQLAKEKRVLSPSTCTYLMLLSPPHTRVITFLLQNWKPALQKYFSFPPQFCSNRLVFLYRVCTCTRFFNGTKKKWGVWSV